MTERDAMTTRERGGSGTATSEAACPDCGHDVDHSSKCPEGCPKCASPSKGDRLVWAVRAYFSVVDRSMPEPSPAEMHQAEEIMRSALREAEASR